MISVMNFEPLQVQGVGYWFKGEHAKSKTLIWIPGDHLDTTSIGNLKLTAYIRGWTQY